MYGICRMVYIRMVFRRKASVRILNLFTGGILTDSQDRIIVWLRLSGTTGHSASPQLPAPLLLDLPVSRNASQFVYRVADPRNVSHEISEEGKQTGGVDPAPDEIPLPASGLSPSAIRRQIGRGHEANEFLGEKQTV